MLDFLIVGHVVKDRFPDEGDLEVAGGTAWYASLALAALGARVGVVTRVAPADEGLLLEPLCAAGIELIRQPSARTTVFVHAFPEGRAAERVLTFESEADPLALAEGDLPRARVGYAGPLTATDVPLATLRALRARCDRLAIDLQGLIRHATPEGMRLVDSAEARAALGLVDIVKADLTEAAVVTGAGEPEAAAQGLAALGPAEVLVTMSDRGSYVLGGGEACALPALTPERIVDPTGCGDTFLAAYLFARAEGEGVAAGARFAAAAATAKLEQQGALRRDAGAVRALLARHAAAGDRLQS